MALRVRVFLRIRRASGVTQGTMLRAALGVRRRPGRQRQQRSAVRRGRGALKSGSWGLALLLLPLYGCTCAERVSTLGEVELAVAPAVLRFPPTWVGASTEAQVEVRHLGGPAASLPLAVDGPFSVGAPALEVPRGSSRRLTVRFTPSAAGAVSALLTLGELSVTLEGEGREPPTCPAPGACEQVRFDFAQGRCAVEAKADATSCATACVTGACQAGECRGLARSCPATACTVGVCSEPEGCSVVPRVCPAPSSPCQEAVCDEASGCGVADKLDGTLCGPDDCTAVDAQVCIAGQCVSRPRPPSGRCSNTWVPLSVPARNRHAAAFEVARGRLVLFGGASAGGDLDDTWTFDGARWQHARPAQVPSRTHGHAMVWDAARQRVVLTFPGAATALATWEWDGVTWLERRPSRSPPERRHHGLAYDAARRRVVLFGGMAANLAERNDTWEWDGVDWTAVSTAQAPSPRFALAMTYDAARARTVLYGGMTDPEGAMGETWEYDGASWTQRSPTRTPPACSWSPMADDPQRGRVVMLCWNSGVWEWDGSEWYPLAAAGASAARWGASLTYDPLGRRVLLFGGQDTATSSYSSDLLAWDGTRWTELSQPHPVPRVGHALVTAADGGVLLFGGTDGVLRDDTWALGPTGWSRLSPGTAPGPRFRHALAPGLQPGRVLLFGGAAATGALADTWEYDGATWAEHLPSAAPPARRGHAMALDEVRRRVVLFGGSSSTLLGDTWEWDGVSWTQAMPAAAPSARQGHRMAWDAARGRVLLVGGSDGMQSLSDLWEWNGAEWMQPAVGAAPPDRAWAGLAFDVLRGRVLMFGGARSLGGSSNYRSDTWALDGAGWSQAMPLRSPPAAAEATLAFDPGRQRVVLEGTSGDTWVFVP